mgnify:CR=1 FL=1
MLSELLAILAPIMISVGAGFVWGKTGTEFPSDFISRIVMNIGTPCLIISVMAKVDVQPSVMGQVALATAIIMSAMGYDLLTATSAVATSLANVGPGIGPIIGPAGNFSTISDPALYLLSVMMLLGRLEILTVLVLLMPIFWRS